MYQLVQETASKITTTVLAPFSQKDNLPDAAEIIRPSSRGLLRFYLHSIVQGIRLLRTRDFDLVMGGSALVTPLVYLLSMVSRLPGIVYVHGLDLIFSNLVYQMAVTPLLRRVDRLYANSSQTKSIAVEKKIPAEKVFILHPGIHTANFQRQESLASLRKRFNLQKREVLLYAGRLAKRKGILEFIKYSLPGIVKERPDVLFCVVGDNPKSSLTHKENIRQQIELEVQKQGLERHIRLFGWVDRESLLDLYAACDIFLLPAISVPGDMEGFGIVLAEANAAGKPAVSTKVGGIPDAVEHGSGALLVESGQWDDFSAAVIKLLAEDDLREFMGRAGRQRVENVLDWSVTADRFIESIRCLLDEGLE